VGTHIDGLLGVTLQRGLHLNSGSKLKHNFFIAFRFLLVVMEESARPECWGPLGTGSGADVDGEPLCGLWSQVFSVLRLEMRQFLICLYFSLSLSLNSLSV
jgi:hypothetical protein